MKSRFRLLSAVLLAGLVFPAQARIILVPDSASTIQAAIALAQHGDTVVADTGVYDERVDLDGKRIVLASTFLLSGDSAAIGQTIISPSSVQGTVVTITGALDSTAAVIGLTLRNGQAGNGGGIYCQGSSPRIEANIIEDNLSGSDGGGIMITGGGAPRIAGNIIRRNRTNTWGGGIYVFDGSSPVIEHNVIYDNGASLSAVRDLAPGSLVRAGRQCRGGKPLGGFLYRGGGILVTNYTGQPTAPVIVNNTIDGNDATTSGGGIYVNLATPDIRNNIVASNQPHGVHTDGPEVTISYNDVWGNGTNIGGSTREGQGSISANPLYVDPAGDDFHLQFGSPCIDAGDPASPPDPDSTRADMGAYWFFQTGTAEHGEPVVTPGVPAATIVRGVLFSEGGGMRDEGRAGLLDISGREVMRLRTGANDVGALSPGVYFLREGPRGRGFEVSRARKVVVTR